MATLTAELRIARIAVFIVNEEKLIKDRLELSSAEQKEGRKERTKHWTGRITVNCRYKYYVYVHKFLWATATAHYMYIFAKQSMIVHAHTLIDVDFCLSV